MDDDQRPDDERGDSALRRTATAQNAERVPEPGAHGDADSDTDTDEAAETGEKAAAQAERLESHTRRTTQPPEPGAPQTGGDPPLT